MRQLGKFEHQMGYYWGYYVHFVHVIMGLQLYFRYTYLSVYTLK